MKNRKTILMMARIGVLGAIATILYCAPFLQFGLPFFPPYMKMHLDDLPIIFAAMFGPIEVIGTALVKTLFKFIAPGSETFGIGEFGDLIMSLSLSLPLAIAVLKKKTLKRYFVGLSIGFALQLVVSFFLNMLVLLPVYMFVYDLTEAELLGLANSVAPDVKDLYFSYGLYISLPFNVLKSAIVFAVFIPSSLTMKRYLLVKNNK
ncbi:MAG: ECF transporter S component [Erysipelotrichaceae bacterium]|jgi:riboflavin transporter FmnP|nr:ECF transporter S component [Erysipelotrichaceae bacterium]